MEALSKNKIKWIRALRLKKNRDLEKLFVVEGAKMVQEILDQWPGAIECIVTLDAGTKIHSQQFHTGEATMKQLTALKTPSSMLAIVRQPELTEQKSGLILMVDGIQDPGNMGTIIRTADWFGVSTIVCSKETVDIFNPKVIQSSMGSLFRIPCVYADLEAYLKETSLPVYGALMEGTALFTMDPIHDGILVVGNEGNGVSSEIISKITQPVHIPGKGGAESLNVAVATGILLSHFSR